MVEIKLDKPLAISVFNFYYIEFDSSHTEKQYMRDSEIQYIPPTDSSRTYISFAKVNIQVVYPIKSNHF